MLTMRRTVADGVAKIDGLSEVMYNEMVQFPGGAIGIALNTLFVAVEAFYGWKINSLALLADAGHNLSDVAGLILAWGGALAGRLRPDDRHTYGWKRATILAAFINAMLLLVAMGSLAWEAIDRLNSPQPIEGVTIMVVAGLGIVINTDDPTSAAMATAYRTAWNIPLSNVVSVSLLADGFLKCLANKGNRCCGKISGRIKGTIKR